MRPKIFISSVSKELGSARQLIANTLQFMGYDPDWQDVFETEQGDLRAMLRRRIDEAHGVLHLVGHCYGAEPPQADEQFGRVSYTQYEALYARQRGKKLWTFILDDDFPTDDHEPESQELRALQAAYRENVTTGSELYYPLSNHDALEASTLKLRSELAALRRGARRWAIGVSALLMVILSLSVWLLWRQDDATKAIEKTARTSEETAAVAERTATIAQETADVTQRTAETTEKTAATVEKAAQTTETTAATVEKTAEAVEKTGQVIEQTHSTVVRMDTRETLDSASQRVERAVEAMNLSNQGQVAALELLLANGYSYVSSRFDGVDLTGADLHSRAFTSTTFIDANLTDVNLDDADLNDATAFLATANGLSAVGAKAPKFRLQFADAERARFDNADLTQGSLYFSRLRGASFRGANCTAANFAYADLTNADFTGADLTGAQFIGAVLEGANFADATFNSTDMSGAVADDLEFTDAQRAEMCRSIGFRPYLEMVLVRKTPSTRFDSGFTFDDAFRVQIVGVPGTVPGTLRIRRGDTPEPSGFTAAWHPGSRTYWVAGDPRVRFSLEADFLNVGDRLRRIRQRIDAHGQFLIESTKRLDAIEGDGLEFTDWLATVRRNTQQHDQLAPLALTEEDRLMLGIHSGATDPDSVEDWQWQNHANERYEREWPRNKNQGEADPNAAHIDGWPRLYPPSEYTLAELPAEHVDLYRQWTINRAKALRQPDADLDLRLLAPRRRDETVDLNSLAVFEHFVAHPPHGRRWTAPEYLQHNDRLFQLDHRYVVQLETARTTQILPIDKALELPINARIRCQVLGVEHVAVPDAQDQYVQVIRIRPISATVTGSQGLTWEGNFNTLESAPQ